MIPLAQEDVASFPSIAYTIPDFEGQAILRIFANSTESEIGCYTAVVTNGKSFSHPKSVGTVLGIFAFITIIASFATAIYGEAVPTMRLHYAHSLSVGVVMAVFQHIFFTGALSVNWPSVLVAWWSNFAWAGGMIHSDIMQRSINSLIGANIGNTSQVGAAPSDSTQDSLGGGYDISSIYKRSLSAASNVWPANHPLRRDMLTDIFTKDGILLQKRDSLPELTARSLVARDTLVNKTSGYKWYGDPVGPDLPLPGNYSGFAGTLAQVDIPTSSAFMTGFLWFLILLVLVVFAVVAFKWTLEGLVRMKWIKEDRLKFFRDNWRRYALAVGLRTCYIGFFLMMFLTIFEFTYQSSYGVKIVAALVFVIFIIGVPGIAWYAVYYKKHLMQSSADAAAGPVERKKLLGFIPVAGKASATAETTDGQITESSPDEKKSHKPFWKRTGVNGSMSTTATADNVHDHDDYTMKFGWLSARFRNSRWWFFTVWLAYEFLRAVFYAGASGYALAQVFGLLIIEFVAFIYIIWARPFEGRRLNILVVYCLGFSKVASIGLSAAFDVHFNLARITTTVIGIVIIIIQGVLTVITMIAVVVGAISSYMSVSRNHDEFRPRKWHGLREKYFDHLDRVVNDLPREPKPKKTWGRKASVEEVQPGFEFKGIRRENKIEDDDAEFVSEMNAPDASYLSLNNRTGSPAPVNASASDLPAGQTSGTATPAGGRRGRATSMHSVGQSNLPYGARPHRPSWSTREFSQQHSYADEYSPSANQSQTFVPIDMTRSVPDDEPTVAAATATPAKTGGRHSRSASLSSVLHGGGIHRSASTQSPKPQPSSDSLRIGEVSTRDTIGKVPAPPMTRPRSHSGTQSWGVHPSGSQRGSRVGTPVHALDEGEGLETPTEDRRRTERGFPLMTPAQEVEEWATSPPRGNSVSGNK